MKKLNLKKLELTDQEMLQKKQLKSVCGGYGGGAYYNGDGSCTATLDCATGSISCTSDTGDCKRGWGEITCDGISYTC